MSTCWAFRTFGNKIEYVDFYSQKTSSDTTFLIKSLVWPGYYFFYKDGSTFSLYIGNGQKFSKANYFPKFVYEIQSGTPETRVSTETAPLSNEDVEETD